LDALVLLSDELVKYDAAFEQSVNKLTDILTSLNKGQQQELLLVNEKSLDQFVSSFQWNTMKYRTDKSLQETTATLNQVFSRNIIVTRTTELTIECYVGSYCGR
jgi:V-type H+-transporting ATPase subunit C